MNAYTRIQAVEQAKNCVKQEFPVKLNQQNKMMHHMIQTKLEVKYEELKESRKDFREVKKIRLTSTKRNSTIKPKKSPCWRKIEI